jgi:cyanophycin synthetase
VAAGKPQRRKTPPKATAKTRTTAPAAVRQKGVKRSTSARGMFLELTKEARSLTGCGFGIRQPVMIGALNARVPDDFDFAAVEPLLAEFALAPLEDLPGLPGASREAQLVCRIHAWHAAIQRGANVPLHGSCRIWDGPPNEDGVRKITFAVPSFSEQATIAAFDFVVEAVAALAQPGVAVEAALPALRERFEATWPVLRCDALTGTNSNRFVESAHRLAIEHYPLFNRFWVFGQGRKRVLFNSSLTSTVAHFGVGIARDKLGCAEFLSLAGLPVARSGRAKEPEAAIRLALEIGYPVVVKPVDSDGGSGVTTGIGDEADLRRAFDEASKFSDRVMVEKHHDGADYRVTVVNGKAIKVLVRRPAGITGDGTSTITQLVAQANAETRALQMRQQRPELTLDHEAQFLLAASGLTADSVIPANTFMALRRRGNISAGGTFDVLPLETIHPDNLLLAQNAAATMALDIAGVDIISEDPRKSWRETGGIICEVNASPQIGYTKTERIFDQILTEVLGGNGEIPVHLVVTQDGSELRGSLPTLAAKLKCNAAAGGTVGWIDGAGELGPFPDAFRAARAVLFDTRADAAIIAMTESELLQHGLPAARFASIRATGKAGWQPSRTVRQLIEGHSQRIVMPDAPAGTA